MDKIKALSTLISKDLEKIVKLIDENNYDIKELSDDMGIISSLMEDWKTELENKYQDWEAMATNQLDEYEEYKGQEINKLNNK